MHARMPTLPRTPRPAHPPPCTRRASSTRRLPPPQLLETLQFVASAAYLTAGVAPDAAVFSSGLQWSIMEGPVRVQGISNVGSPGSRRHREPQAPLPLCRRHTCACAA
jgi:hypothetical protein